MTRLKLVILITAIMTVSALSSLPGTTDSSGAVSVKKEGRSNLRGNGVMPYVIGERLRYRGYWMGIPVGWAELSVTKEIGADGKPILHFRSIARSTGFFSLFYKVDDQIDSYIELETMRPISYRVKQREGRHKNDKRIDFNHVEGKATYYKNQLEPIEYDLVPGAQDPLSALYYVRMQDIKVGHTFKVQSFVRRKNAEIEVKVLKQEVIETDFGILRTHLLTPSAKYEGIFKKTGRLNVWLSADDSKIPVRMESKIMVGAIMAVLIEVDEETAKYFPQPW